MCVWAACSFWGWFKRCIWHLNRAHSSPMRWHLSPPISVYQIQGIFIMTKHEKSTQERVLLFSISHGGESSHNSFGNWTLTSTLPPRPWLRTVTPIHCPSLISSLPGGSNVLESMSARRKKENTKSDAAQWKHRGATFTRKENTQTLRKMRSSSIM